MRRSVMEGLVLARIAAAGVFLAVESICDIRKKEISLWTIIVFGAGGAAAGAAESLLGGEVILSWIPGLFPGLFLILAAKVTREGIGYGDGAVLMVSGMYLGFVYTLNLLLCGLLLSALAAVFLITVKKAGRKYQIPFLPFLFLGYCVVMAAEM